MSTISSYVKLNRSIGGGVSAGLKGATIETMIKLDVRTNGLMCTYP